MSFRLAGQVSLSDSTALWHYNQAERYFEQSDFVLAAQEFEKAFVLYKENDRINKFIDCSNRAALTYWALGDDRLSMFWAKRSDELIKTYEGDVKGILIAEGINILGLNARSNGNMDKAERLLRKSVLLYQKLDIGDSLKLARCYLDLGTTLGFRNRNLEAISYVKKAINFQEQYVLKSKNSLSRSYLVLATLYSRRGRYNQSLYYTKRYLQFSDVNSPTLQARLESTIGSLYLGLGKVELSSQHINKSLELLGSKKNRSDVLIYSTAADFYNTIGDSARTIFYINKLIENQNSKSPWPSAPICNTIGNIYFDLGNSEKAVLYLERSVGYDANKFVKKGNIHQIKSLNKLGHIHSNNLERSSQLYQDAIIANTTEFKEKEFDKLPHANDVKYKAQFLSSLDGKANIYKALFNKTKDPENLINVLDIYDLSDTIITGIRGDVILFKDQIEISKRITKTYNDAIEISLSLYEHTKNPSYLIRAIHFSDRGRFGILKNSVANSYLESKLNIPREILEKEKNLSRLRNYYLSSIRNAEFGNEKIEVNDITAWEKALFGVERSYDSLTDLINLEYREKKDELIKSKKGELIPNLNNLDEKTAIVEYYISLDRVYIFTLTSDTMKYKVIELRTSIDDRVNVLRNSIKNKNIEKFRTVSHSLYKDLLAPIVSSLDKNELIIIPHGSLWHLNFDLLLTRESDANDPKKLPYLLKEYSISYANSIDLMLNQSNNIENQLTKETIAFSYSDSSTFESSEGLSFSALRALGDDLPGSRKEIANIAEIVEGKYYYGSQSNEKNFKAQANKYSILHLALHGEIDDENPLNSRLYFSPSKDSVEDNYLYGFELNTLHLPADLAILSACNTGDGKIAKGEGILSLGSAFQYAGTKSLVLSSWEVSDDVAPEIMKYFYTNLKKGMNKAEALRQAKLKFLEEAPQAFSDPFYWGNFYLVGDNSPIEFEDENNYWWLMLLPMVIAIALIRRK